MFNIDSASSEKEQDGIWHEYQGSKFKIAYAGNPSFLREFNRLQYPYRRKIERGQLDPVIERQILSKALAKAVLLDWSDVVDGSGKVVNYTQSLAEEVLLKDSAFREFVQDVAMNADNYRQEVIEATGK